MMQMTLAIFHRVRERCFEIQNYLLGGEASRSVRWKIYASQDGWIDEVSQRVRWEREKVFIFPECSLSATFFTTLCVTF